MTTRIFIGSMIHVNDSAATHNVVEYNDSAMIIVENGKIIEVMENADQEMILDITSKFYANEIVNLKPGQFLIPGFIDCHTYPVQYPNLGLGYDKTLLDWQEAYTYPLEKVFFDQDISKPVFDKIVKRSMFSGTTTACYSASLYNEASTLLAETCAKLGQRAFIGKINMNARRNDGYYESTRTSIANTKAFIESVKNMNNPLVQPIITPRSALTCDMQLLQSLGRIAAEKDLLIQSNVSQDPDEVNAVKRKFGLRTYTDVYKTAGLLDLKTILAHGTCLEKSEVRTLADKKIPIVHCPTSNLNLRTGLCNATGLMDDKVKICLGTDISGGSNYNILYEMKQALRVSYSLNINNPNFSNTIFQMPLTCNEVFVMATLEGAKALQIDNKVGNFKRGKEFDALVINFIPETYVKNNLREKFEKFIYCGTSENIESVYINGKKVK